VAEEASRRDPQDRWSQMGVVVAAVALAEALLQTGETPASVRHFREALRIGSAAAEADPQNRYVHLEAAAAEYGLGRALLAEGTRSARVEGCASLARVQDFWTELHGAGALPPGETEDLRQRLPALRARCR
jgi:hypothetical protein